MKYRLMSLTFLFLLASIANAEIAPIVPKTKKNAFIEYHNRMTVFSPSHIAYERIKTRAFYVGIDAWVAPYIARNNAFLGEAELRMGYNFFFNGCDHLTPIGGVGYLQEWHHSSGIVYGALGFLYDHEFNSIFNLGLNAKGLIGDPINRHRYLNLGAPVIGCDVSLPITFRIGHKRHWDYRIEPFNLYVHGTNGSRNFFGFRESIAYRY